MTPKRHVISHEENWNVNIIGSGPSEPGGQGGQLGNVWGNIPPPGFGPNKE